MLFKKNAAVGPRQMMYDYNTNPDYIIDFEIFETDILNKNGKCYQRLMKFDFDERTCYGLNIQYHHDDGLCTFPDQSEFSLPFTDFLRNQHCFNVQINKNFWNFPKELYDKFNINTYPDKIGNSNKIDFMYNITTFNNILFYNSKEIDSKVILFKVIFDFDRMTFGNFKNRMRDFVKVVDCIKLYSPQNMKLLFNLLDNIGLTYNGEQKIWKNIELNNDGIIQTYNVIKNIDSDKLNELKDSPIDIEHTKHRFNFLQKYGHQDIVKKNFKLTPFKLNVNVKHNDYYIKNFFGEELHFTRYDDLHAFEKILYVCNKYNTYETQIRRLILEVI